MVIKLSDIENEELFAGEVDCRPFLAGEAGEPGFPGPVTYRLKAEKTDKGIHIGGTIKAELFLVCSRCLEEYSYSLSSDISVELEPMTMTPGGSELELRREEMDIEYFEGEEIDLDSIVYEEVLLNLPMMPLCSENCRGLCDICGINKNTGTCTCKKGPQTVLGEKLESFLKR